MAAELSERTGLHNGSVPSDGTDWQCTFVADFPPPPSAGSTTDPRIVESFWNDDDEVRLDARDAGLAPPGYRLVRRLGRGAMGEIFLARHQRLRRMVALKMIRGDAAGPYWRDQFLAEAQAVARLQHPHIIQVFEVGESSFRPYLALEYADAGTLADRLSKGVLSPQQTARWIQILALAVQHAHDRGLVHRDLKPSNILLSARRRLAARDPHSDSMEPMQADDVPKIGDFGLAAALGSLPAVNARVGTPSYMAPEQAGSGIAVGPQTDVYSLGAVMYECLCGRPPFHGATVEQTLTQVRDNAPAPLPTGVPRDLAAICRKCLQKKLEQRYGCANALASDLGRFLRGEPIAARRIGAVERLWKWARRRPVVAGLSMLSLTAVLALLVGGGVYQSALRDSLHIAERHRQRSESNHRKSLDAVDRLLTRVGDEALAGVPEMEGVRAAILQDALEFYQGFLAEAGDADASVRWETAQAQRRVARILAYLGRSEEAIDHNRAAIVRLEALVAEFPQRTDCLAALAETHLHLGTELTRGKQARDAGHQIRRARTLWQMLSGMEPEARRFRVALALCDHQEGWWQTVVGRLPDAEAAFRRAAEQRRQFMQESPDDLGIRRDLAKTLHSLAKVYSLTRRVPEAISSETEAAAIFESLASASPADEQCLADWSAGLFNLGILYAKSGRRDLEQPHHERALRLREALAEAHPRVASYRRAVAQSQKCLAGVELNRRRPAEAVPFARQAVATLERLSQEQPHDLRLAAECLDAQTNLALALQLTQRVDDAVAVYEAALAVGERLVREEPTNLHHASALAALCLNRGFIDQHSRRPHDALLWFERSVRAADAALGLDARYADAIAWKRNAHGARAQTFEQMRDFGAAVGEWDRVVELSTGPQLRTYRLLRLTAIARAGVLDRARSEADSLSADVQEMPSLQHLAEACATAANRAHQDGRENTSLEFAMLARDFLARAFLTANLAQKLSFIAFLLNNAEVRRLPLPPTASAAQR